MNKIFAIISREYTIRVRKRTFWILTLLIPVFYAGLIGISVWMNTSVQKDIQQVNIVDKSGLFAETFQSTNDIKYIYHNDISLEESLLKVLPESEQTHVLIIPEIDIDNPQGIMLYSSKKSSNSVVHTIQAQLNMGVKNQRISKLGLDKEVLAKLDVPVIVERKIYGDDGIEEDYSDVASGVGFIAGFLNYMFIFIYGSLVLRGVHEEKSSRIVEIIVSTVKPFELMMGKIIGVALVGLTQFLLWVGLIAALTAFGSSIPALNSPDAQGALSFINNGLASINIVKIILIFIFYFVAGYLLYSSLFASIAAAVDNQSDMQQFMLPLTIPLIISIVAMQPIIENPGSNVAIWMSIIPFTAPISMMARVTFDVPVWELALSMSLLVLTFIATTWMASRIYRVGILIYGSKVSYKDILKWLFYK